MEGDVLYHTLYVSTSAGMKQTWRASFGCFASSFELLVFSVCSLLSRARLSAKK